MDTVLKKIIVPVDGSQGSAKAAAFAGRLARLANSEVVLLHIYDSTVISVMGLQALSGKEIDDAIKRVSQTYFDTALDAVGEVSTPVRTEVRIGHPGHETVAFAEAEAPDLIVMGNRGQSDVKKVFVGSVSSLVIQHAPCPVTVVR